MGSFFDLSVSFQSKKRILDEIELIIDKHQFIMGPHVANLETNLQEYTGARHCVTCASGTDALILALLAANVRPGDKVITTPFTFAATAEAIAFIGAIPIFCDIDIDTFNLSPKYLDYMLSITPKNEKPKAIIAVDLFGLPAEWDRINEIAIRHGMITTIADAAQSFGAAIGKAKVGTLADITCTSFFPTKPLGCFGDGGAVFTDFDIIAEKIRALRVHGSTGKKYHHQFIGMNSRLDTIQAAVLIEKLKFVDHQRKQRKKFAELYGKVLQANGFPPQKIHTGFTSAYSIFSFRTPWRDIMQTELEAAGIQTAIYYPIPLHEQGAYAQFAPKDPAALGSAESVSRSILSLPIGGADGFGQTIETRSKLKTICQTFMSKDFKKERGIK
jgi:UDP-2-acetamido-2-deoxy-ribo-hexuluronate aminotransferase